MRKRIEYDTQESIKYADPAPSCEGGINNTLPEQLTQGGQTKHLSDGQNVYTDIQGGMYSRKGSVLQGGTANVSSTYFIDQFTDSRPKSESIAVFGDTLYHFDGTQYVPVVGAPTLPAKLPCSGVYFPDIDKYFISNGTDPILQLDQSTGTLTATAQPAMPRGKYLGYNDNHLYVGDLGVGQHNVIQLSNKQSIVFSNIVQVLQSKTSIYLNSTVALNGNVMGFEYISYNTIICVTKQRAYRISGTAQVTDENSAQIVYSPNTIFDIGASRCAAPFTIKNVGNAVYWLGADELNGIEIYRTDGQVCGSVAGRSIKIYLQYINTAAISSACACQYGPYYKVALPYKGSVLNDTELLLDTQRSNFSPALAYQGIVSTAVFEPLHKPGYAISRYALFTSSGQDFILAAEQGSGTVHRQGVGYGDEVSQISTLLAASSTQVLNIGEAYAYPITLAAGVPYRTVTFSTNASSVVTIEKDLNKRPSGVLVNPTATAVLNATLTTVSPVSSLFSAAFTMPVATSAHVVIRAVTGQITIATSVGVGEYFSAGVWGSKTASPAFTLTGNAPITSYATYTTPLSILDAKKKTIQSVIAAQSTLGSVVQFGVGTDGRESIFSQKPLTLNTGNTTWAASLADSDPSRLHWAVDPVYAKATERWASLTTSYTQTLFAPMYVKPSVFLAYQFFYTGYGDWRINSFTPMFDVIPSTL